MFSIRTLLYLLFIFLIAGIIHFYATSSMSFWVIWSAFIFSLVTLGNTFRHRLYLIAMSIIASALAAGLAGIFSPHITVFAVYLLFVTVAAVYFVESHPDLFIPAFMVPIFAILGGNISSHWADHLHKLIFILLGGAIVIFSQVIFFSKFKVNESAHWLVVAIDELKTLTNEIFSCFQASYADNVYVFERRIHLQKLKFMHAMQKIRQFDKHDLANLENLFDILLDCSQLRNRINDYTIFSLCTQEMNELLEAVNGLFAQLLAVAKQQKVNFDTETLEQKIVRFDEIYQNVLQVTAKEPSVFALFLGSIKKLKDEMQQCYNDLLVRE